MTDPLGHTTSFNYDSNGNRTSVQRPGLAANHTVYNAVGAPTQATDEVGNVRTFTYDGDAWPKLASDINGPVMSFSFNSNGTVAAAAFGYDLTANPVAATTYTYDQYGNMTSLTDPLGRRRTTSTYDTLGRLVSTTSPAGGTTTNTYNALGRLINVAEPLGRSTTYAYDSNGNKTSETDANGHTTAYQYDALNRLILVTYPTSSPNTVSYTYDFRNNVITTTDQASHVTRNNYDVLGRLISTTSSYGTVDAAMTTYTYYNDGRKATQTDPNGPKATYNYDAAGRLS